MFFRTSIRHALVSSAKICLKRILIGFFSLNRVPIGFIGEGMPKKGIDRLFLIRIPIGFLPKGALSTDEQWLGNYGILLGPRRQPIRALGVDTPPRSRTQTCWRIVRQSLLHTSACSVARAVSGCGCVSVVMFFFSCSVSFLLLCLPPPFRLERDACVVNGQMT